jgi:uroporphyrinogen-III synthase
VEVFKIYFPNMSKEIDIYSYDMIVFFSPYGIQNLRNNYPDFKQKNIIIGALGTRVATAAQEAGLDVQIIAPTLEHPSIFSAIDQYLQKTNGQKR